MRRRAWVIGLMLGLFGFGLMLYAGFAWDGAPESPRPKQLVNAGATLLFIGGGLVGLDVIARRRR